MALTGFDLNVFGRVYSDYKPRDLALKQMERRQERLYLIWRILNRVYDDHLIKPPLIPDAVWEPLVKRFTVTDLASPVLSTINSATYGGRVHREIKRARNREKLIAFMDECGYVDFVPVAHRYAVAYGTSFVSVGRKTRSGRRVASLAHLHPISTQIIVPDSDVDDIREVVVDYGDYARTYSATGITDQAYDGSLTSRLKNSNYGFIPVTIGRARVMDAATPYGQDLIWPAVEETKQITALMCDLMVLERNQSYSTLVTKGELIEQPKDGVSAPWSILRGNEDFDAYWISPSAKIEEINSIIESKFERAATQCQVPVDLFVRSKSGTQQAAGAAALSHKPLYDLVIEQQRLWRDVERDLLARIDAFLTFEATGEPVDLEAHRAELEVDISFEHETHPAFNQSVIQAMVQLRDSGGITNRRFFKFFNDMLPGWESEFSIAQREAKEREFQAFEVQEARLSRETGESDIASQ